MSDYVTELENELTRAGRARQRRRLPHIGFGTVGFALAAGAAVVVAVVAIALAGQGHTVAGKPTAAGTRERDRARDIRLAERNLYPAAAQLLSKFRVFAAARGPFTETPAGTFSVTHSPVAALPFPLLALARGHKVAVDLTEIRHVVTSSGVDLWVIPAPDTACFAEATQRSATGACARSLSAVTATGLWTFNRPRGRGGLYLVGMVPSANTSVTAVLRDGRLRRVPVVHGVVATPAHNVTAIKLRCTTGQLQTLHVSPELDAVVSLY